MKGRGTAFNNAIKQMEDYISDPVVCHNKMFFTGQSNSRCAILIFVYYSQKNKRNAHVQPSNIVVKTERTVEKCLGIKHEASNLNGSVFNASNSAPAPSTNDWVNEKQELINNIVRLKSENQKCILDLKKSEEKLEILAVANRELEEKCHAITAENDSSQEDLKKTADKLETMAIVNRELEEKCRAIIDENKSNHEETDEGNYHEVECLLRDKIVQKRAYLVRWKGFDSSHDSWILESDLNCPKLLLKYKQSKRK